MRDVVKIVVVFIELDEVGQIPETEIKKQRIPYGFHHIIKLYRDGSFFVVATISCSFREKEDIEEIAEILANGIQVEFDSDFYLKV